MAKPNRPDQPSAKKRRTANPRVHHLGTRLTDAAFSALKRVAEYEELRVSALIRVAVLQYLNSHPYLRELRNVDNKGQQPARSTTLAAHDSSVTRT